LSSLLTQRLPSERVALYAEQPYTLRTGADPDVPAGVADVFGRRIFEPVSTRLRDRVVKWRAIQRYRSQLPLLGMRRRLGRGPSRYAFASEWVAWAAEPTEDWGS
jgi:hypothetical protein